MDAVYVRFLLRVRGCHCGFAMLFLMFLNLFTISVAFGAAGPFCLLWLLAQPWEGVIRMQNWFASRSEAGDPI